MQVFPISDHIVVEIEKESVATLILMKENKEPVIQEIEEPVIQQQRARITINCNCEKFENKLSICCWMSLITGIIFIVVFFIAWGRFNKNSQHYPPPPN